MRVKLPENRVVIVDFEIYRNGKPFHYRQVTYSYQTKTAHMLIGAIKKSAEDNVPDFNPNTDSVRITNIMRLV